MVLSPLQIKLSFFFSQILSAVDVPQQDCPYTSGQFWSDVACGKTPLEGPCKAC